EAAVLVKKVRSHLGDKSTAVLTPDLLKQILAFLGYDAPPSTSLSLVDKLASMAGEEFEEFVASIYKEKGYQVDYTQRSGDHGIDLILHKENKSLSFSANAGKVQLGNR